MPVFRYQARDAEGQLVQGEFVAADAAAARVTLVARRLAVEEIEEVASASAKLSAEESLELVRQVADLTQAELPLAAGLRAAAEDLGGTRLAVTFESLAGQLETGASLSEAIERVGGVLAPHHRALLSVSLQSGNLGETLQQLIEQQLRLQDVRHELRQALAYPVLVLLLLIPLGWGLIFYLMPMFTGVYEDFDLTLPAHTEFLIWLSTEGRWAPLFLISVLVAMILALRWLGGKAVLHRLRGSLPLVGPLFQWTGLAEWTRTLSLLLEQGVPLPTALRSVGEGTPDAYWRESCRRFAEEVEQGASLEAVLANDPAAPPLLAVLSAWGMQHDQLPEAFAIAGRTYEHRALAQTALLRNVLPPILFLLIAAGLLNIISALLTPLVRLISSLT